MGDRLDEYKRAQHEKQEIKPHNEGILHSSCLSFDLIGLPQNKKSAVWHRGHLLAQWL
jgi:hypothetical protein